MDVILSALSRYLNYLRSMDLTDVLDILIVAYLIYQVITLVRRTNFANLAKGLVIFLAAFVASYLLDLNMINYILRKAVELGLIAVLILFQPELRRLLERIGSGMLRSDKGDKYTLETALEQVTEACVDMSSSKTGALIIFERNFKMHDIVATGTPLDAEASAELIKNIFYNKAPLHDGALIIRDGRLASAGCVLPLTKSNNLSKDLGMRHRAGIGLSEVTDAVVVIVSEETGAISMAIEGNLKRHLSEQELLADLQNELIADDVQNKPTTVMGFIKGLFKGDTDDGTSK